MTRAWITMMAIRTDRGNSVLATSFATALARADCLTLTGVKATGLPGALVDDAALADVDELADADELAAVPDELVAVPDALAAVPDALAAVPEGDAGDADVDGAGVSGAAAAAVAPAGLSEPGALAAGAAADAASRCAAVRSLMLVCSPSRLCATIARADASSSRWPTLAILPPTCASQS